MKSMIPVEHQSELVDASMRFLQTLDSIYGNEKAMEMWSAISNAIDPDLKGLIFTAMLNGHMGGDITITKLHSNVDKIALIKAIRTWDKRVLSLSDAKLMLDDFLNKKIAIKVQVFYHKSQEARQVFRNIGCM